MLKCKANGLNRHTSCFITYARLNVILSQNVFCYQNCDSTPVLAIHIQWLPRRACTVPVCPAAVTVLWVLQMGTAGYCGYCGYCTGCSDSWVLRQYPWVLQGTVGTVGTVGAKSDSWYCGSTRGYCRVLWVL